jgi:hypothetical protein
MRLVLTTLLLTLLAGPLLACSAGSACAQSVLRLNEIMAGPSRDWNGDGLYSSRDDEWVELVNTATYTLALDGFVLTDADSVPRYALSGSLGPGERLMVTGKQSYDWEKANGQPAYGLSLGNTSDAALLWRIAGPETLLVDSYAYTSHQAAADRSVGRSPDGTGGWVLFDSLNPYTGALVPAGTGCVPSPAALNVCGTTPARPVTWGRLKTLYR